MTNIEAELIVREIGKVRVQKKINLYSFDAWFLFGVTNRIYSALLLTKAQRRYLMLILYKLKNDKYLKNKGDEKWKSTSNQSWDHAT